MAYLRNDEPYEAAIQTKVLRAAWQMWREEMAIAVQIGIVKAFGGGK